MARYRHPRTFDRTAAGGFAVDVGGRHVPVDEAGEFTADAEADRAALTAIARAHDTTVAAMRERAESDDTDGVAGGLPVDPGEETVAGLKDALDGVTNVDTLRALLEAERGGKDRKTARDAIQRRINMETGGPL